MPVGAPNKNTIRVERYQKKVGYMSKTYKLKRDVVERFAAACDRAGASQASTMTQLMEQFIAEHAE